MWLASCASPPDEPVAVAEVSLESYRGVPASEERATALPRRLDVLVDLTKSMGRAGEDGRSWASEAYSRASNLLLSLPQGTEITLRAQGHQAEASCAIPERLAGPAIPTLRIAFVRQLEGLGPRTEGSLAAALAHIRLELEREEAIQRTRVVVFTDLDSHCGGDVCEEARTLVEAGARLKVVALGEAPLPRAWPNSRPPERLCTRSRRVTLHLRLASTSMSLEWERRDSNQLPLHGGVPVRGRSTYQPACSRWWSISIHPRRLDPSGWSPGAPRGCGCSTILELVRRRGSGGWNERARP